MLDAAKLSRIVKSMEEQNVPQMIISDPLAIYYLIGKKIAPGERLLALYINVNGTNKMVINELFPQEEDLGVDLIYYNDIQDGVEILSQFVEKDKTVGVDKTWPARFLLRLQELGAGSKFVNGSPIVDYVRMIKDEREQELMRKASLENDKIMEQLVPLVVKGYTELELNAIVRDMYAKTGHSDVSFDPITGYGKSGADPHHVTDNTKGKRGDSVVLDIGGILNDYCSDMTRTVFAGNVSDEIKSVYNLILKNQLRVCKDIRDGMSAKMLSKSVDSEFYLYNYSLIHALGHGVGLEIHEMPYITNNSQAVLKENMVVTNEPGIYINGKFGIRIEDTVRVGKEESKVLTKSSKEIIVVDEK